MKNVIIPICIWNKYFVLCNWLQEVFVQSLNTITQVIVFVLTQEKGAKEQWYKL